VAADRPPCRVDLRQRHVQLAGAPANGCVALARKEFARWNHTPESGRSNMDTYAAMVKT
jgi:hypothetical protein